jgi:DNA-binding NarL/FixJ family response regulator
MLGYDEEPTGGDTRLARSAETLGNPDCTIVLIDARLFRGECFAGLLRSRLPNMRVGLAASVDEAVAASFENVSLVVLSVDDHEDSGCTLARVEQIGGWAPETPIVLISTADHIDPPTRTALFQSGVRAVLSAKSTPAHTALAALNLVAAGGSYFSEDLLSDPGGEPRCRDTLTSRQSEVLRELRKGKPNKIIAYELGMSESTVKVHVRNLMRKLGATNRTQVVFKAGDLAGARGKVRGAA